MASSVPKLRLSSSRDIPFDKLVLSQSNVRRVKCGISIGELAEDIVRRTLLQSLNVRAVMDADDQETGMFEVPAGGRRFRALELLVKSKRMAKTQPVPCVVREGGSAEEDSLAENVMREALHPLDQFRAFKALREQGTSEEEIAARFFVTPSIVKQRLRLASVSEALLEVYADDGMTLDQLMAFSVSSDHVRQEQIWADVSQTYADYLGAYSEFSQVHQSVASNIAIDDAMVAASSNFSATRMIYGDMFEAFGSNIETLVALNNLIAGRPFDQLQNISLAEWQKTDKAGHGKALEQNAAFAAVCEEMDAQLRNGSHHGGMILNRQTGAVEFRAGKGGQGDLQTMSYARYLARCSKLFIQEMLLMRVDIFVAHRFGVRLPL